jgi:hypothetical protein
MISNQIRPQNSHFTELSSPGGGQAGMVGTRVLVRHEDRDARVPEGLFEKAVDTLNTAKDIAHVMWNVGWR